MSRKTVQLPGSFLPSVPWAHCSSLRPVGSSPGRPLMLLELAVTTTTGAPPRATTTDPALERVVWALVAAVVGLLINEAYKTHKSRRDRCARDRAILSAVLRELSVILGIASSITVDVAREREMLTTRGRWSLKPFVRMPTLTYDLIKDDPPAGLLAQDGAIVDLVALVTQCAYTNDLADAQMVWKTPAARGQADQVETIASFHVSIMESVKAVVERAERLRLAVRAAGATVGGLNLGGPPGSSPSQASGESSIRDAKPMPED
jgi:hypothetical protein